MTTARERFDAEAGRWPDGPAAICVARTGAAEIEVIHTVGNLDEVMPLASVTKPLVALAVLIAVEEGALSLEDRCGPPGATVRHVLAHASGLAADTPEAQKPPGTRRIYSNAGYELLGTLLSDRTGFTAQQYVQEAVFEPLGMRSTTLIGSPASAAHSCVRDLLSFVDALARPGLIDSTTLADILANQFGDIEGVTPGFGNQRPNSWGLGPERHGNKSHHWMPPEASPETVGHFGQSGTFFWFDPIRNLVLIGLGRVRFGAWAVELWPRLGTLAGEILTER